jgi:two-component system, NarL family, nitrate/nitrite response regulator NarL
MVRMETSNFGSEAELGPMRKPSIGEQPNQRRIRLVLLDDHALLRESLARLLALEHEFELVAECATPTEALEALSDGDVDVVLVDFGIAGEFIPCAHKAGYHGKSLVVTREIDARGSASILSCGASGIFLESEGWTRLTQAIRLVANGDAWVDQKVIRILADRYPRHYEDRSWATLTQREQTVLKGIVDGLSNRQIGIQMGVSESTVKGTLQQLFTKARVRTRSQLVRMALEGPPLEGPAVSRNGDAG